MSREKWKPGSAIKVVSRTVGGWFSLLSTPTVTAGVFTVPKGWILFSTIPKWEILTRGEVKLREECNKNVSKTFSNTWVLKEKRMNQAGCDYRAQDKETGRVVWGEIFRQSTNRFNWSKSTKADKSLAQCRLSGLDRGMEAMYPGRDDLLP